jgi:hypothetical protein
MPPPTELVSIFEGDLPGLFESKRKVVPLAQRPAAAAAPVESHAPPPETWVSETQPSKSAQPQPAQSYSQPAAPAGGRRFDYMPDVRTLGRPDELLLKPPYYLVLYASRRKEVEVECSHSPTLQFLSDYLKKWVKANHNDPDKVRNHSAIQIFSHLLGYD